MGFFSKKKKEEPSITVFQWASNAPDHWPPFYSEQLNPNFNPFIYTAPDQAYYLHMTSQFLKTWELVPNNSLKMLLKRTFLDQKGVVEVPWMFEDKGTTYPVFLFPVSDVEAANRFKGLTEILNTKGYSSIYYTPRPLPPPTGSTSPFTPLVPEHFSKWNNEETEEKCFMWWSSTPGEQFSTSICAPLIDRAMRGLDGYTTSFIAWIGNSIGIFPKECVQLYLPVEPAFIDFEGPEERLVRISLSREKGLRVHFPIDSTPPEYCDAFWQCFVTMIEDFRKEAIKAKIPLDRPEDRDGLGHWEFMRKNIDEPAGDEKIRVGGG